MGFCLLFTVFALVSSSSLISTEQNKPQIELVKNKKAKSKKKRESQTILQQQPPREIVDWKRELQEKVVAVPPSWMLQQIHEELAFFTEHPMASEEEVLAAVKRSLHPYFLFCSIKNGKPSFYCYDSPEAWIARARAEVMCQFFANLAAAVPLSDCYFVYDLADGTGDLGILAPVFGPAKFPWQQKAILMPNFELANLDNISNLLAEVSRGSQRYSWEAKEPIAFWRGATTGGSITVDHFLDCPRAQAVTLSLKEPHLIDAKFHMLVQSPEPEKIYQDFPGYFGESRPIHAHLQYKYQLLIDGNTTSWSRAYWQLCSNCLVLKQITNQIEYFYPLLIPYVHFVPLKEDLSDLEEKLLWARAHDAEARQISLQANALAKEWLSPASIYYYTYLLLKEFSTLCQ